MRCMRYSSCYKNRSRHFSSCIIILSNFNNTSFNFFLFIFLLYFFYHFFITVFTDLDTCFVVIGPLLGGMIISDSSGTLVSSSSVSSDISRDVTAGGSLEPVKRTCIGGGLVSLLIKGGDDDERG